MRLIDADALKGRFENLAYDDWNQGTETTWANAFREAADVVENMPTIDAVEVVRCRDCEWYKTNYTWDGKERKVCGIEPFEPMRREEDYCAYGERKE